VLCHEVPGVVQATQVESCQSCHEWIQSVAADPARRAVALESFPLWPRYEQTVHSYEQVPNLQAAMARLEPEWIAGYLNDPHDLRPHLDETMPRMDLSEGELTAIALWFSESRAPEPESPAPSMDNLAAGEALFTERGCNACHTLGGRFTAGIPLAPDLAHTRDRMAPGLIAAWIQDPKGVSEHATMPAMGVSWEEALQLRDFILLADLQQTVASDAPSLPEPAEESVSWEQVNDRVFGRICAHCHMKPDWNEGRAGPGNAGGFGWEATGIELQSCESVAALSERIPDTLARRNQELARDHLSPGQAPAELTRPERPGMPVGLPAIPDPDIALVLAWIDQGSPCPPAAEEATGETSGESTPADEKPEG
jgi:cytochrome c5